MKSVLKKGRMDKLVTDVLSCHSCELYECRQNPVLGEGDLGSPVVFVGEAPGRKEDETGRPFVGSAGRMLDQFLRHVGLERGDVYITNIVKCRPPGNRRPRSDEILTCTPYLEKQLDIISPRILAPLGNSATGYIMKQFGLKRSRIGEVHGKIVPAEAPWGPVVILPLFHPAAVLYNRKLENAMKNDFESLKRLLDREMDLVFEGS